MTCLVYICVQTTELHRCTVLGETEPSGWYTSVCYCLHEFEIWIKWHTSWTNIQHADNDIYIRMQMHILAPSAKKYTFISLSAYVLVIHKYSIRKKKKIKHTPHPLPHTLYLDTNLLSLAHTQLHAVLHWLTDTVMQGARLRKPRGLKPQAKCV